MNKENMKIYTSGVKMRVFEGSRNGNDGRETELKRQKRADQCIHQLDVKTTYSRLFRAVVLVNE